jgi:MFS superfamily sulfate permease-like transporter
MSGRLQSDSDRRPLPFATGLRRTLAAGYTGKDFRADLMAGIVVGIVALPLSMALAIAVGAPPQHGLYTAMVAGTVVALTGGSKFQITGPTAAFIVILAPIVTKHGLSGLLTAGFMAGILLVIMGIARLGRLIQYAPKSDVFVLVTCYLLTVLFDMVVAVSAGIVLAALLFMRRMAELTHASFLEKGTSDSARDLPEGVSLYEIAGPLFFGAAQSAMGAFETAGTGARVIILDLARVPTIDATGLVALESAVARLERPGSASSSAARCRSPAACGRRSRSPSAAPSPSRARRPSPRRRSSWVSSPASRRPHVSSRLHSASSRRSQTVRRILMRAKYLSLASMRFQGAVLVLVRSTMSQTALA